MNEEQGKQFLEDLWQAIWVGLPPTPADEDKTDE